MKYLKIELKNKNSQGIYYIADERIGEGTVSKSYDGYNKEFKLRLLISYQQNGKRVYKKKIFIFPPAQKDKTGKSIATTFNIKDNKNNKKIVSGMTINQAIDYINKVERPKLTDALMYPPEEEVKIPTLKESFYDYMQEKKNAGKLRPHTALNYEKYFEKHLKPLHNKEVDKITQSDLVKIKNKLQKDGLSSRTIKTLKECLSPMFNYYIGDHASLVTHNPTASLIFKDIDNERTLELTNDERKRLFNCVLNYEDIIFRSIFIWCFCGRRKGEVLGLKWCDIDLDKNEYTIPKEINKAKRDLTYILHPIQLKTLETMQNRAEEEGYTILPKDCIFPSIKDPHIQMHKDTPSRHWKNILIDAELDNIYEHNIRIHDTRTIIASYLAEDDDDNPDKPIYVDQEIGSVLGHIPTGVTKRYVDTRKKVANRLLTDFFNWIHD